MSCGGTASTSQSGGTGGGSSATTTGDLSGTWDVIVTESSGRAKSNTVAVTPALLQLEQPQVSTALFTDQDIAIDYKGNAIRGVRNAPTSANLGIFPLPLSGAIHFSGTTANAAGCDFSLDPTAFSFVCTGYIKRDYDLPSFTGAQAQGTHSATGASVFGDLGGTWLVSSGTANCQAVLAGSTITIACSNAGPYTGQVTLNVNGNLISGSTSGGLEFTAQRR
jgi:hypothetical protein